MTTRQQLEADVRRYFAERGLFVDLHTPFGRLPSKFPKPYRPTSRTLEQLPQWLDYWLEGRPPPLPGELEVVSVEWCPRCDKTGDPLDAVPDAEQMPTPEWLGWPCIRCNAGQEFGAGPIVRRWGLRRRRPKARGR